MSFLASMILECFAYHLNTLSLPQMVFNPDCTPTCHAASAVGVAETTANESQQKEKVLWVKHLVLIWAIILLVKGQHHIGPSKLRSVSIEGSKRPVHEVERVVGVQFPKAFLRFPERKSFAVERHAKYYPRVGAAHSNITSSSETAMTSVGTARGSGRPHGDNCNVSASPVNSRRNIGPSSQSGVFSMTGSHRPMLYSTSPTPTRTAVASSTTTCTTISSSSPSPSSTNDVPISRTALSPHPTGSTAAGATIQTNSNAAIPTSLGESYPPHFWDIPQDNRTEIGEISQTLSISSDEQNDFFPEDWDTGLTEWDEPQRRVAEDNLVAARNGTRDGPDPAVGYLGGLVNGFPLNDLDVLPPVTNGNPVMVNDINPNHGGAPAPEADDLAHGWTQINPPPGYNHVEVPNSREIHEHQRTWLERSLSFPLGLEGRAQLQSDIAMQVTSIDDILYGSNDDDEHIEDEDEEDI